MLLGIKKVSLVAKNELAHQTLERADMVSLQRFSQLLTRIGLEKGSKPDAASFILLPSLKNLIPVFKFQHDKIWLDSSIWNLVMGSLGHGGTEICRIAGDTKYVVNPWEIPRNFPTFKVVESLILWYQILINAEWFFFHYTSPNCPTTAGCVIVQLDSDTIYLEITSQSTGEGLSPVGISLLPHPHLLEHTQIRCQCKVLGPPVLLMYLL